MNAILPAVLLGLFSPPAGIDEGQKKQSPETALSEPRIRTGPSESPIVTEEVSTPDSTTYQALAAEAKRLVGNIEVPAATIRLVRISDPRPLGEEMSRRHAWAITVPGLEIARRFHQETTRADVTLILSEDDHRLLLVYTQPRESWVLREEGVSPVDIEERSSHWWSSIHPVPASRPQHTVTEVLGALWWLGVNPSTAGQILLRPRLLQLKGTLTNKDGTHLPSENAVCWVTEVLGTLTLVRSEGNPWYASGRFLLISDADLTAMRGFRVW